MRRSRSGGSAPLAALTATSGRAGAHAAARGLGDHAARRAAQGADPGALVEARAARRQRARAARRPGARGGRWRPCARRPRRARRASRSARAPPPRRARRPRRRRPRRRRRRPGPARSTPAARRRCGTRRRRPRPRTSAPIARTVSAAASIHACAAARAEPLRRGRRATAPRRSRSRRCARSARGRSAPPRARRRVRPDRPPGRATPPTSPCSRHPRSTTSATWSPSSAGSTSGLPASAIHQPCASWSKRATLHRRMPCGTAPRPISSPLVPRLALLRLLLLPLRGD